MPDHPSDEVPGSPARPEPEGEPAAREPVLEHLDEAECLRLMSLGGIGRIAYSGQSGVTVLPVNYKLHEGAVGFRTAPDGRSEEHTSELQSLTNLVCRLLL